MKRGGQLPRRTPLKRKAPLRVKGISDTATIKDEIQALLREIVMLRDGQCILADIRCNHIVGMPGVVFQAEHLIERSNSATYADSRLVVCVCRDCHGWKHFKKSNHDLYDVLVKQRISPERVALWEKCDANSWRPQRTSATDWKLTLIALKQELRQLQNISANQED